MGDYERIRLVTLGGAGVGKSSLVKRFLFKTFSEKYKPTVEDLYNQEYNVGSTTLKLDILDTAGDQQFPAMRRLCIATAHAFLIVYSIDSQESMNMVKGFFEEINEQRADFHDIPVVVVGNKMDLSAPQREVHLHDVLDWLNLTWPYLRVKAVETSAKEDKLVDEAFKSFIQLSKKPFDNDDGFKRRSSAHVTGKESSRSSKSPTPSISGPTLAFTPPIVTTTFCDEIAHDDDSSSTAVGPSEHLVVEDSVFSRNKPRSRSLIRRSSKKVKQTVRDASGGPGDCRMA